MPYSVLQCVTVFSPLLHLWVLCYPSHCCIHFWILKSRSQYTPKADPLRLTRLSLFLLSYIYFLFCFEVCFFSSCSPALPPYLWKKCQHWGLSASFPWMNGARPTVPPTCLTFWFGFKCLSTNGVFVLLNCSVYNPNSKNLQHCKA